MTAAAFFEVDGRPRLPPWASSEHGKTCQTITVPSHHAVPATVKSAKLLSSFAAAANIRLNVPRSCLLSQAGRYAAAGEPLRTARAAGCEHRGTFFFSCNLLRGASIAPLSISPHRTSNTRSPDWMRSTRFCSSRTGVSHAVAMLCSTLFLCAGRL